MVYLNLKDEKWECPKCQHFSEKVKTSCEKCGEGKDYAQKVVDKILG